ncbi:hypothetical protein D3C80_1559350 [compost metagenome]
MNIYRRTINQRQIGCTNNPFTRIASYISHCIQLFDVNIRNIGFFLQFTKSTSIQVFIHIDESTGQSPFMYERVIITFNEQYLQFFFRQFTIIAFFLFSNSKNNVIRSYRGTFILIRIIITKEFFFSFPQGIYSNLMIHFYLPPHGYSLFDIIIIILSLLNVKFFKHKITMKDLYIIY